MCKQTEIGEFAVRQETIKDKVLALVRKHPSAISDYRKLIQYFWYYEDGMNIFVPLNVLERLTQPESIARAFRKLVETGEIRVDPDTGKFRVEQEAKFREFYRKQ